MNWWLLIFLPLSSAFVGWLSNQLVIKMAFRAFSKRQTQLAQTLAPLLAREFASFSKLEEKITNPESIKKIMPVAEVHMDDFLRNKLKEGFPMITMVGDRTLNTLKEIFMKELESIFPVIMKEYMQNLEQDLNLEQTITNKIANLNAQKIKTTIYQHAAPELRKAALLGAGIGFVVGLVQVTIIMAFA
ncbi:DUF445 domain-containing protein [Niastella yeongjuensis]|uniref:DUF445 domain-containing protein n=1 Tax=Niastella yeongjuensis TaxID=354355 RepID=A0A1V9EU81_9BACT|nr:DUF445 domain-containing protein [Niastella yeongjuensis]OQP49716.1 DUF445 domain-containing protein [Niastella yeongjuensis]SEP40920.1 hypothetical protein SAMN05660816_05861 [Niastella yeongjuensis]